MQTMSSIVYFYTYLYLITFLGGNLGPPGKPHQMEDSYSPYNLMSSSDSPTSPLVPQDNWGQGKRDNDKMANGTNINWPPGEEHSQYSVVIV